MITTPTTDDVTPMMILSVVVSPCLGGTVGAFVEGALDAGGVFVEGTLDAVDAFDVDALDADVAFVVGALDGAVGFVVGCAVIVVFAPL